MFVKETRLGVLGLLLYGIVASYFGVLEGEPPSPLSLFSNADLVTDNDFGMF